MEEIAGTESTCTVNGHETYYRCSGCKKLYSDKSGDNEISLADVLLPKLWHDLGETWDTGDLTHHWKICSVCGEKGEIRAHTYDYVPADASADGKAYRKCSVCGKVVYGEISDDTPGDDTPGGETPGGDTPGDDTPGGDTPGDDTPGGDTPGDDTPGDDTPGGETPGGDTPGGDTPGSGIGGILSGNVKWSYEDGTLTLSGTGAAEWTSEQDRPWKSYDIRKIVIQKGITAIGDHLFGGLGNVTEVSIADTVTVIGAVSFGNCENLTQIRIPESVTTIDSAAFWDCLNLADITLPGHLTYIGADIFINTEFRADDSNWKDGVLYYGKYLLQANAHCGISGSYTILDGTELIAEEAFYYAVDLTSIRVPKSVKYIGDYAMGIENATGEPIPDFKIFCYAGSAAEAYAMENGVAYELIAEEEQPGGDTPGSGSGSDTPGGETGGDIPGGGSGSDTPGGGTGGGTPGGGSDIPGSGSGSDIPGSGSGSDIPGSGSGSDIPGGGSGGDTTGDGSGSGTPGGGAGGATPSGSTGSTAPGTPAGPPKTADSLLRFGLMFLLFVSSLAGTGVVLYNYLRRIY